MMQGKTAGRVRRTIVSAIARTLCVSLAAGLLLQPEASQAQERSRTVFDMLFGGPSDRRPPPGVTVRGRVGERPPPRAATRPRKASPATTAARGRKAKPAAPARAASRRGAAAASVAAAATAAPETPEKVADARKILVVGDFMADALADGLRNSLADDPNLVVVEKSEGSSGLVRTDHFDWGKELSGIVEAEKPDVMVVMIGSNDRQPIETGGASLQPRSDGWVEAYKGRIAAIVDLAKERKIPLVWVGMPSFKFDQMNEDVVFLNDLYRNAVSGNGDYVDVWDGFVDASGVFTYSGPDVSGQTAQLRNSDGITMTDAGDDKLAFYAEKPILRLLRSGPEAQAMLAAAPAAAPTLDLASIVAKPPISLSDPSFDGGEALLGGGPAGKGDAGALSPRDKLVLSGAGTGQLAGRADSFAWNDKSSAVTSSTGAPIAARGSVDLDTLRRGTLTPPPEMPDIMDAIINEWDRENAAARGGAAGPAAPAPATP
ncbi:DUF459 domain-containing protein [Aurantimonas sp. Leaf443]|uniref:SGNH/GDSL hydrolase family protein n=1 Tax=Aurantimonas sp. Leaf443 TaxID=1736378 RepID=UPI0006FE0DD5|nr:DUF459 domain-containing protein [Aurantimonas sp. Leaf443]KQT85810.1 hypothetical protein ASG48_04100 [Aurantimonas sp. Leaf443]